MAFVHQNEVVALERTDCDGLLFGCLAEFVDVDDVHRHAGTALGGRVFAEKLGVEQTAAGLEVLEVLVAQALVGGEQKNAIQRLFWRVFSRQKSHWSKLACI